MTTIEDRPVDSDGDPIPSIQLPETKAWEMLSEEEACLYAILTDHSGIDLQECLVLDESNPDGCWRAWDFQYPHWRNRQPKQIDQCVGAGQLVQTATGLVPIEDVRVGDLVLTHTGRWQPVTAVWDRGKRDVVAVRGQGHPGLIVTPDHPIYARRSRRASKPKDGHKGKKLLDAEWMQPQDWEWNDNSGKMHANWGSPATIDPSPLGGVPPMSVSYRSGQTRTVDDTGSLEWLWLYGHYIAQGAGYEEKQKASRPATRKRCVTWSVPPRMSQRVADLLRVVGLNPFVEDRSIKYDEDCHIVTCNSKSTYEWLRDEAGVIAPNKRLAPWVHGLPAERRQAVLDGIVAGDGHLRPSGQRWELSTTSWQLVVGIRLLAHSLGYSTCVTVTREGGPSTIKGRPVLQHKGWSVGLERLCADQKQRTHFLDGHAWTPVTRITDAGSAHVYDLEVDEDQSYVVDGIVVHNCARAIGKSRGILARCLSFPFRQPGQEMVITAPQAMHVDAITDQIEHVLTSTWILNEMLVHGRSGINHRPFKAVFANGARIIGRIPQTTGVGVKGCLVAGTMVETRHGPTAIEQIVAGEMVRTHEGRWRRVTAVHHYEGATFSVTIDGHPGVQCSTEHPFRARVGDLVDVMTDDDSEWLRADDILDALKADESVWVAAAAKHDARICQFEGDDGFWYSQVTSVIPAGDAKVYDITVDEDHSYVAAGLVMHNTHPVCLEMDEASDYPARGWTEIIETFNRAMEGAEWRIHGVARGIPDKFQELITNAPGNGFALHRYTAIHRPTWTPEEREAKIQEYGGSENNPEYRRNVLGELGPSANRIFELRTYMRQVDTVESSDYNLDEFFYRRISAEQIEDRAGGARLAEAATDEHVAAMLAMLDFPEQHKRYEVTWAGMDVGVVADPSEIVIAAEYQPDAKERRENDKNGIGVPIDGQSRLKIVARVSLDRIPEPLQIDLVMWIVEFYRPRGFGIDKGGLGIGLFQGLQRAAHKSRFMVVDDSDEEGLTDAQRTERRRRVDEARKTLTVIKGYNFSEKLVVEIDEALAEALPPGLTATEIAEKAGIKRNTKDWATDLLRGLVGNRRLMMPYDKDMISQMNGQSWVYANSPVDAYGKRRAQYSEGQFHILDGFRFMALAHGMSPIEAMLATPPPKDEPVLATWVT